MRNGNTDIENSNTNFVKGTTEVDIGKEESKYENSSDNGSESHSTIGRGKRRSSNHSQKAPTYRQGSFDAGPITLKNKNGRKEK